MAAVYLAFDIGRGTYYNNLGTTHMAEGEYDEAIACFTKALKARRKSPEAYCNRGTAYSEKGEHDKAIADLSKAIELNPEFADAYYNRAVVHYQKQQYGKSWQELAADGGRRTWKGSEGNPESRLQIGVTRIQSRSWTFT